MPNLLQILERFVCRFWDIVGFQHYLPSLDIWKTERVNRVLEDMLRMYAMHHPKKWDDCLPRWSFSIIMATRSH
jgi:hypothetical protein